MLNKKKLVLITVLIVLSISQFSGCINNNSEISSTKNYKNTEPVKIVAPKNAYFNENIDFEAKLDSDYKISSYVWNFQDGSRSNGKKTKHSYEFIEEYNIEYPLIYTVTLFTEYEDNSIRATEHQIKLYPKAFTFYLNKDKLSNTIPMENIQKISNDDSLFENEEVLIYNIDEKIPLEKCHWNLTLFFEKPFFSKVENIKIIFYDENFDKIIEKEKTEIFNMIGWKKEISLKGDLEKFHDLNMVKIIVKSISLFGDIKIMYGGDNPSNIFFNFDID